MQNKSFKNRLFLHREKFKDRVIIAYPGSSFGNARGLTGGYVSQTSCMGFIYICFFKKWFIFTMMDAYLPWWGSHWGGGSAGQGDAP